MQAEMNLEYSEAKIVIGSTEYSSSEYDIKFITISNGCYDGSVVGIGAVYSATISITMQIVEGITKGTAFSLYFQMDGKWKKKGNFFVNEFPAKSGGNMTLEAYGSIGQFEAVPLVFAGKQEYYTLADVQSKVEEITGCSITYLPELTADESETFLGQKVSFLRNIEDYAQERDITTDVTVRAAITGLAILFGGNAYESGENIVIRAKSYCENADVIFGEDTYRSGYQYSQLQYAIRSLSLSFLPWSIGRFTPPNATGEIDTVNYLSNNGERVSNLLLGSSLQGDYVFYDFTVECDWIGWTSDGGKYDLYTPPGGKVSACYTQGDLIYRTGSFTFAGYNDTDIVPGNVLRVSVEGQEITLYCGEIVTTWDGGFTMNVSCECSIETGAGSYQSTPAGQVQSAANASQATGNHNDSAYANTSLSNVENADEKFIATLTSNEIFTEQLTTNDLFVKALSANSAFIDDAFIRNLVSNEGYISYLTSDEIFTTALTANAVFAEKLVANETFTEQLTADEGFIDKLSSSEGFIASLMSNEIFAEKIEADVANINTLNAESAIVKNIFSESIIGDEAILNVLQTKVLDAETIKAATADFGYMTSTEADLKYADITFANIDTAKIDTGIVSLLLAEVGLVDRATIVEGHVTKLLDAVEINASSITSGTLVTDRLLLRGSEGGVLYALNNSGDLVSENVDSLDGYVLTPRTINADRIEVGSITATEIDVANLFAQEIVARGSITGATLYGAYAEIDEGCVGGLSLSNEQLEYNDGTTRLTIRTQTADAGLSVVNELGDSDYYISLESSGLHVKNGDLVDETTVTSFNVEPEGASMLNPLILSMKYYGTDEFRVTKDGVTIINLPLEVATNDVPIMFSDGAFYPMTNNTGTLGTSEHFWNRIYSTGATITNAVVSNLALKVGAEIYHPSGTPYIDFHHGAYGTETKDYTTRLIEEVSGTLKLYGAFNITKNLTPATDGSSSLGTTSKQFASVYSENYYQNGVALENLYAVVSNGKKSTSGTGTWVQYSVSFGNVYQTAPLVSILPTTQFAAENIRFVRFTMNSSNGYIGMTYEVYCQTSGFTYSTRWFVIGNIMQ